MLRRFFALSVSAFSLCATVVHATPANLWTHRYTGTDDKWFERITVDPSGNIIGAGYFYNTITINTLFTTLGFQDIFVAKFDPNGNPLWSKQIGGVRPDHIRDVTTDLSGNVIVVGDMYSSPSSNAAFIAKYAPDGTQRFLKTFGAGDDSTQSFEYVTTDLSKHIIIAGDLIGSLNLGGATLHDAGGPTNFIAKLDANGDHIWSRRFNGTHLYAYELAGLEARDGQFTLCGILDGTVDFGNGPLSTGGADDIFLARFDTNGNAVWSHKYGGTGAQDPGNIAINESGNIALVGYADSPVNFGGGVLTPTGFFDPVLAVFTPAGTHVWSKIFTGAGIQYGVDVTWGANQDVLMQVRGNGTLDFGAGPVTLAGPNYGVFIARFFGATGNHRWSTSYISTGGLSSVIEEDDGKLIMAGYVVGDIDFGSGLSTGDAVFGDAFLTKFGDNLTGVSSPVVKARLEQNVPNPFNPVTTIGYTLDVPARAVIAIHDAAGALVARIDEGLQSAGAHSVTWNGLDRGGRRVASGVYFYRLEGLPETESRKMVLLK